MRFNSDPSKKTQEVYFSLKVNKEPHLPLMFNKNIVTSQKYLNTILGNRLLFEEHLKHLHTVYQNK